MSSSPAIPFPTLPPPQTEPESVVDSTQINSAGPDEAEAKQAEEEEPPTEPEPAPDSESTRIIDEASEIYEDESAKTNELRTSLGKLIELCRTLTSRLSTLEPQLTELQTTLTLTQSNLTLSLANTEMLEDALRTNATRDVGWRRSDSTARRPVASSISYPPTSSTGGDDQAKIVVHAPSPTPGSGTTTPNESRFFKFRFGSKTPSPTSPAYPHSQPAHLASASLPSLGLGLEDEARAELSAKQDSLRRKTSELEAMHTELSAREEKLKAREEELRAREEGVKEAKEREKELVEVKALLEAERKAGKELEAEKKRVEEEIETLTQSLFEEANKMVADERRRAAEVEALLRETEEERDAVRGAMRVVEGENGRLRELSAGSRISEDSPRPIAPPVRPATPPSPETIKTVTLDQEEANKTIQSVEESPASASPPLNGVTDSSSDELSVEVPPLPESSPDPWKAQAQINGSPPRTPPRVHALPTETSPWAEGRA